MNLRKFWRYFTSNKIDAEFVKYTTVAILGWVWMFLIMYVIIDFLKLEINFWFLIPIDTWKFALGIGSLFGLVHNFLLNKFWGGLSKITKKEVIK